MPRGPDLLPDWFVGGAGKRRLIRAVLDGGQRRWTPQELADAAELGRKNSAPRHIAILVQARVLRERQGRYQLNSRSPLIEPLDRLLSVLEQKVPPQRLPRSRGGRTASL